MYFVTFVCLWIIISCKQRISKTIWSIFAKFVALHSVHTTWEMIDFWCRSLSRWLTFSHFSFWNGCSGNPWQMKLNGVTFLNHTIGWIFRYAQRVALFDLIHQGAPLQPWWLISISLGAPLVITSSNAHLSFKSLMLLLCHKQHNSCAHCHLRNIFFEACINNLSTFIVCPKANSTLSY